MDENEFDYSLISRHRKLLGISQQELADYLGITRKTLSRYENKTYTPSPENMQKLFKFLSMKDNLEIVSLGIDQFGMKFIRIEDDYFLLSIPLVRVKHYKTFIETYDVGESEINLPSDKINDGYLVAFEVKERSMDNESKYSLSEGDIAICKEVSTDDFISEMKDNFLWVFMLDDEIIFRKVKGLSVETNEVLCTALNPSVEFSDFSLDLNLAKKIYQVIGRNIKYLV